MKEVSTSGANEMNLLSGLKAGPEGQIFSQWDSNIAMCAVRGLSLLRFSVYPCVSVYILP